MAYEKVGATPSWKRAKVYAMTRNNNYGAEINKCVEANDETGEYAVYETNKKGRVVMARDDLGRSVPSLICVHKKGNIGIKYS